MVGLSTEGASKTRNLLHGWLSQRLTSEAFEALSSTIAQSRQNFSERTFLTAFSTLPRRVGKRDLLLNEAELQTASLLCPGWSPGQWSVDQAARSLLLLSLPQAEEGLLSPLLEKLYPTAGIPEAVALHQTLPLLPYGDRYQYWALEGFRSHITAVFNAIALWNSYPARQFDEATWNQLVLKAIFVGSPLYPIWELDDRANATLSRMLMDYVHERWAAHRNVTPELWRLVVPFVDGTMVADLKQALCTSNPVQQHAIGLACIQSGHSIALDLLAPYPALEALVRSGTLTWKIIYEKQLEQQAALR
ncbi:EboA domain-containing protein [Phormidesmis sp. 146-35]